MGVDLGLGAGVGAGLDIFWKNRVWARRDTFTNKLLNILIIYLQIIKYIFI